MSTTTSAATSTPTSATTRPGAPDRPPTDDPTHRGTNADPAADIRTETRMSTATAPETSTRDASPSPATAIPVERVEKKGGRRRFVIPIVAVLLIAGLYFGGKNFLYSRAHESHRQRAGRRPHRARAREGRRLRDGGERRSRTSP